MLYIENLFSVFFISQWAHAPFLPFSLQVEKSNFTHNVAVSLANVVKSRSFETSLLFRFLRALMLVQILISTPSTREKIEKLSRLSYNFWPYCNPIDFAKQIANADILRPISIKLIVTQLGNPAIQCIATRQKDSGAFGAWNKCKASRIYSNIV